MQHYRQHRIWIPATNAECIGDTVTWLPHHVHMPTSTAEDIIISAANDLTHALLQSDSSPLLPPLNTETRKALQQLQLFFTDQFAQPLQPLPSTTLPKLTKLPRVPKSAIAHKLPRVPTTKPQKASNKTITNTADFRQLSTIRQQRRRLRAAKKPKSTPSTTSVVPSLLRRSLRTHILLQRANKCSVRSHHRQTLRTPRLTKKPSSTQSLVRCMFQRIRTSMQ